MKYPSFTWEEYIVASVFPNPYRYVFDTTGETAAYVNFNIASGIAYSYAVGGDTWFSLKMATSISRAPTMISATARVAPAAAVAYTVAHASHDVLQTSLLVTAHEATELQTPGYSQATTADLKPWWMPLPVFVALYG